MLLLNKKKYAALNVTEENGKLFIERETKGLDVVRRDWCTLSQEVGKYVDLADQAGNVSRLMWLASCVRPR